MVTRACGFVHFDTERDFNNSTAEVCGLLRFDNAIIEYPNHFPAVYQYHEPWDAHFCGQWELCKNSTPMLEVLASHIEDLQKVYEKIVKSTDSKQDL